VRGEEEAMAHTQDKLRDVYQLMEICRDLLNEILYTVLMLFQRLGFVLNV
jgi:hypothetical protein